MFSYFIILILIIGTTILVEKSFYYKKAIIINSNCRKKNKEIIVLLFLSLFFSILIGLRSEFVGTDTQSIYKKLYYDVYVLNNSYDGNEFLFYALFKLGYIVFHSFKGCCFAVALFSCSFAFFGLYRIKKYVGKYFYLGLIIYICFYVFDSFNIIRQMCALSIIIFSLKYIINKKMFKFILCVIIAFFFHNSALICLLIVPYLGLKKKILKDIYTFFLVFLIMFSPLYINIFQHFPLFSVYLNRYHFEFDFSIYSFAPFLYNLPFALIVFMNRRKIRYKNLIYMELIGLVLCLCKIYMIWLSRMVPYFMICNCALIPICLNRMKIKDAMFVNVYSFVYLVFYYFYLNNAGVFPYYF